MCQHLENNIAHIIGALESCHVEEESLCLNQSSGKWSKEFENMRKWYCFLIFQLILCALSNDTSHPNGWSVSVGVVRADVCLAPFRIQQCSLGDVCLGLWLALHWWQQGLVVFSAPKHWQQRALTPLLQGGWEQGSCAEGKGAWLWD